MKQIVAIVKPFLVEKILDALRRAPLEAVSVREVKGMSKQKSYLDAYADTEYSQTFLPKVEITLWVDDTRAEDVARKIVEVARTGRMGDGKIFILPAEPYEAVIDIAGNRRRADSRRRATQLPSLGRVEDAIEPHAVLGEHVLRFGDQARWRRRSPTR